MKKDKPRINRCLSGDCNSCTHRPINQDQCVSRDEPKMATEHRPIKFETDAGMKLKWRSRMYRLPCSCGWKGSWYSTAASASDGWLKHGKSTPALTADEESIMELLELRCSACDWTGEAEDARVLGLANEHCLTNLGHVVRSYRKGEEEPKTITVFVRKRGLGMNPQAWNNPIVSSN